MKRELLGAGAVFVLTTSLAAADDDRHSTQREDPSSQYSSKQPSRVTQQAMVHIKSAYRALGRADTPEAVAALKRCERMLKKAHDSPPTKAVLQEMDSAIEQLAADPEPEPIDLDAVAAVVRKNKAWLDPAVGEHVSQAERAAEIGDNEGASKSLQIARAQVVSDAAAQPTDDMYLRVLAAQRALANKDTTRAAKILAGIPTIARASVPLEPVRIKLEAAATASEAGKWGRASTLITQARQEIDAVEDAAGDDPSFQEVADIDDELAKLDEQIEQGNQPSSRKLRELARRMRAISED